MPRASPLTATQSGATWRLDGTKSFVLDGHTADLIVVLARRPGSQGEDGLSFFTVDGDAAGLARRGSRPWTRRASSPGSPSSRSRRGCSGEAGAAAAPFAKTMQQAVGLPRQRDGGRRRAAARGRARLHQDAHAVRPLDRLVPDHQEQGGRHAGRCRAGEVGGLLRRRGARRGRRRPAGARLARQGVRPPRPTCRPPSTPCRCMAASASPGTTTPISGSSAPRAREILFGDANQHREQMMQAWAALRSTSMT